MASPLLGVITAATGVPFESTAYVLRMYCGESAAKEKGMVVHKAINVNKLSIANFFVFPKLFNSRVSVLYRGKRYL